MPDRVLTGINGPRGTVLISGGTLAGIHVLSCLPLGTAGQRLPVGLALLNEAVPLVVYAAVWAVPAVLAWWAAFLGRRGVVRRRTDVAAFATLAGVLAMWSATYVLGWIFDPQPSRAWVGAGLYLCLAGLVTGAGRMLNPNPDHERERRRGRVS